MKKQFWIVKKEEKYLVSHHDHVIYFWYTVNVLSISRKSSWYHIAVMKRWNVRLVEAKLYMWWGCCRKSWKQRDLGERLEFRSSRVSSCSTMQWISFVWVLVIVVSSSMQSSVSLRRRATEWDLFQCVYRINFQWFLMSALSFDEKENWVQEFGCSWQLISYAFWVFECFSSSPS